jgi:hypothetical protein
MLVHWWCHRQTRKRNVDLSPLLMSPWCDACSVTQPLFMMLMMLLGSNATPARLWACLEDNTGSCKAYCLLIRCCIKPWESKPDFDHEWWRKLPPAPAQGWICCLLLQENQKTVHALWHSEPTPPHRWLVEDVVRVPCAQGRVSQAGFSWQSRCSCN